MTSTKRPARTVSPTLEQLARRWLEAQARYRDRDRDQHEDNPRAYDRASSRMLDAGQAIEAKMLELIRPARAAIAAGHLFVDLGRGELDGALDTVELHMTAIPLDAVQGLG